MLALSGEGAPCHDKELAAKMSLLGVPSFACTPDRFPSLMAAAINKEDISLWAAKEEQVTTRARH